MTNLIAVTTADIAFVGKSENQKTRVRISFFSISIKNLLLLKKDS